MNAEGKSKPFLYKLFELANQYIDDCIDNKKEVATSSGKVVQQQDRHIPTIKYFLQIWIPRNYSKKDTIKRSTYYRWLNWDNTEKQLVIKNIDNIFCALAEDIVANEGKGIFYAKNRLGMHDKQHIENKNVEKFDFDE
jgi:uncharacterized protein YaaR (DUF327 family)